jgi:uncharacterized protein
LKQPNVRFLEISSNDAEHVFELLETIGTAGNLVIDAQIAAIAIEQDAVLHTADTDFLRFQNLRWFNPITKPAATLCARAENNKRRAD